MDGLAPLGEVGQVLGGVLAARIEAHAEVIDISDLPVKELCRLLHVQVLPNALQHLLRMAMLRVVHGDPLGVEGGHLLADVLAQRPRDTHFLKLALEAVRDFGIAV